MTVAIDYVIDKNPEFLREVFGLQVAIFNWMRAYLRYSRSEKIVFLIDKVNAWHEVLDIGKEVGIDSNRLVAYDRRFVQENYNHLTTVFRPDPVAQEILWRRETLTGPGYNFCGLAHAISGLETGVLLEQYCLAPTDRSDAIICPSEAVKKAIRSFLDTYGDYLEQRFGAPYRCPIQLPVIPLGIDVEKFTDFGSADKRSDERQKLGLEDHEIMVLWVGRLSHAIKAHPLSMFQAVERAAQITGAKVHFVMLGYFAVETDEPHFQNLAQDICRTAKVTFIRNRDERFPHGLWAAADIFLSLVDNMQESFGLTPIESMAAGLPRVISDWDGYRDSVTHGEDGFLVTTRQPPPGTGRDLSSLLLDGRDQYGGYLAKTAMSVSVDQEMAAQYLAQLIVNKDLRHRMAAKAQTRARAHYDWSKIIPAYESFWADMASQRQKDHAQRKPVQWAAIPPQVPDPYTMYAAYPTHALRDTDQLRLAVSTDTVKQLWKHEINILSLDVLILPEQATQLINFVATEGPIPIAALFRRFTSLDRATLWRTIGWLIKLGVFAVNS